MIYFDIRALWVVSCACACAMGAGWSWPEGAESVRIDTKVRFVEDAPAPPDKGKRSEVQSDEAPFRPPSETEGFYNRPPGSGRYPVRVRVEGSAAYRVDGQAVYPVSTAKGNDGTIDSVQYCKCVSTADCNPRHDSAEVCGAGKYLCCYKRPNKSKSHNTEFFNEIDDERPMLYPGQENVGGPFPPPPGSELGGVFGPGHGHDAVLLGAAGDVRNPHADDLFTDARQHSLVGPGGPTGRFGPPQQPVLTGPDGPTGIIGPAPVNTDNSASAQRNVLVGPGGPTGIIGPYNQRPVLVGPGGPTGFIGPNRGGSRGVLVGPGGPTGIIGPAYSRQQRPGLLVGPGGPTGIIGPGRQLLVGPGGPTGHIGPQRYFDYEKQKNCCGRLALLGHRASLSIPMWTQTGDIEEIINLQNAHETSHTKANKVPMINKCPGSTARHPSQSTTSTHSPIDTTRIIHTPATNKPCQPAVVAPARTPASVVLPHHSVGSTTNPVLVTAPKRHPVGVLPSPPTHPPLTYPGLPASDFTTPVHAHTETTPTPTPCSKTSPHPTLPKSRPTPPHTHQHGHKPPPSHDESHVYYPSVVKHDQYDHVPHERPHPIAHISQVLRKRRSFFNGCGSCTGETTEAAPRRRRPKSFQIKNIRDRGAFFGGCGRACNRTGSSNSIRYTRRKSNRPTVTPRNNKHRAAARGSFFRGFRDNPMTRQQGEKVSKTVEQLEEEEFDVAQRRAIQDYRRRIAKQQQDIEQFAAKKKKRVLSSSTSTTTTTKKPSVFRSVPVFTGFLKLSQIAILLGLM